ncbi:MAG: hypothetical protein AVDCRST_MAG89-3203 [uncultured Gemmatimonadetes bacterium]|uniref:Uncharacterized protein n=1 Tax=uncultured Gemmatimonadota bacterium TaxID=203437 RepID=A0A6J4M7U4_9BACT|nr:MAG: hypothetical protein AVDCRST_MAG89-3203 [uncultured Gemmatimonadota bacterium]
MNIHLAALYGGLATGVLTIAHFAVYRREIFAMPGRPQGARNRRSLLAADGWVVASAILTAVMLHRALITVAPGNPRWALEGARYIGLSLVAVAIVLAVVDTLTVWRTSREE